MQTVSSAQEFHTQDISKIRMRKKIQDLIKGETTPSPDEYRKHIRLVPGLKKVPKEFRMSKDKMFYGNVKLE